MPSVLILVQEQQKDEDGLLCTVKSACVASPKSNRFYLMRCAESLNGPKLHMICATKTKEAHLLWVLSHHSPLLFRYILFETHVHSKAIHQGLSFDGGNSPKKACVQHARPFLSIFLRRLLPTTRSDASVLLRRRSALSFVSSSSRSTLVLSTLRKRLESTWTFVGQGERPWRT